MNQGRNPRRSILPSDDELSMQMSPFCDERWDIDMEENRRRKETHRNYVYNIHSNGQLEPQQERIIQPVIEEPKHVIVPSCESPRVTKEEPLNNFEIPKPDAEFDSLKKDYFKFDPSKPKTLSEVNFETPKPPNLYPVLKFPERNLNIRESMYKITTDTGFKTPVPGVAVEEQPHELPPKTQFSVYKDIKFDNKVLHYGVQVPFWQFSNKGGTIV